MGNALLHGQYCIFQFNEDHQRSHDEGSLRGGGHRLPKKYWLWNVQQPGSLSPPRSEEHTSELQARLHLVCRLLLEKKKTRTEVPPPLPDTPPLTRDDATRR